MCNLLHEGNALFEEREWAKAVREFDEGLNISSYAAADDFHISEVLLESLYVSRAAAYDSMVRQTDSDWKHIKIPYKSIKIILHICYICSKYTMFKKITGRRSRPVINKSLN